MTRKVQFHAWGGGQFKRQPAHRPIHALEQFTSLLWSLVDHSSLAGFSLQVFSLSVRWPLYGGKMSFLPFSFPRSIALGALSASRLLFYCSNCMCSVAQGFFPKVTEGFLQSNLWEWPTLFMSSVLQEVLLSRYIMKEEVSISVFAN